MSPGYNVKIHCWVNLQLKFYSKQQAVMIEQRLNRIESSTKLEEKVVRSAFVQGHLVNKENRLT